MSLLRKAARRTRHQRYEGPLNALSLTETYTSGALPYFRTGTEVSSTLALTNVEPAAVDVTVTAIANDGATLGTRKINLKSNGGYRAPLQGVFPSFAGGNREGWLLIQSTGRVAASVLYGRTNTPSLSAISLQKVPRLQFVFPQVVQNSGFHTEVTMVNPSSAPSRLELFIVRPDGVTLAAGEIVLARGARISQRLNQLLPEFMDFGGGYPGGRPTTQRAAVSAPRANPERSWAW